MVGFQQPQPLNINIQIHLLLDVGIAGTQGLNLGVGQGGFINILRRPHRGFGGHDLTDKLLLGFYQLIQVAVEGVFGDIGVDIHLVVHISLTNDAALPLLQVTGSPGTIQMVQGPKPQLHIGAGTHLLCGTQKHPDLSGTNLAEQFLLLGFRIGGVDECDLFLRDTLGDQLFPNIIVDVLEVAHHSHAVLHLHIDDLGGGGQVAKHKLGSGGVHGFLPNPVDRIGTGVGLAGFAVTQHGAHQPLIQRQLSSVVGNQKHIILGGVDHLVSHPFCPFRQGSNHFLLLFRGFQNNTVEIGFGHRQLQHIRSLNICHFLEHGHQLRQVVEPCEAGLCPIAGTLRRKLDGSHGFTKGGCPGIKMQQSLAFQQVILQVPLEGVHFHHGIGDGGTSGKDNASAARDFVQIPALHVQVAGLLGFRLGDAAHIAHFGIGGEVFVVMGLVHEDAVNTQFFKGHKIVLAALVVQLLQLGLDLLAAALHLLDGEVFCPILLCLGDAGHDIVDLLLQNFPLPLHGHGNLLKLAVADDDGIVVAGGDASAEPLAVLGFKVLLGGHQNICGGVQLQKLRCPLLCQVVGHHEQGLLAQA